MAVKKANTEGASNNVAGSHVNKMKSPKAQSQIRTKDEQKALSSTPELKMNTSSARKVVKEIVSPSTKAIALDAESLDPGLSNKLDMNPSKERKKRKSDDAKSVVPNQASNDTCKIVEPLRSGVLDVLDKYSPSKKKKKRESDIVESIILTKVGVDHDKIVEPCGSVPFQPKGDDRSPSKKREKRKCDIDESMTTAERSVDPDKQANDGALQDATQMKPPLPFVLNTKVHRVRYLGYQPKAIVCMSCTPHHKDACNYVAVSHEGGGVSLKSPDEKWRTLVSISGMRSRTVNCMTWICGASQQDEDHADEHVTPEVSFSSCFHKSHTYVHSRRTLIGASRDGTLFVIDFSNGMHTAVTGSGGGGVFALTSLCGYESCKSGACPGLVAAGCEDGSVKIYKLKRETHEYILELVSAVPTAGAAVLSIAWRHFEPSSHNGISSTVMYAGIADGTIRRYERKNSIHHSSSRRSTEDSYLEFGKQAWTATTRMTVECLGRTNPTRVWALKLLADGTMVSGDSLGHVQLWDGETGTLLHSFEQNDQKADILALAVTPDECKIFASGIDSRVICIERSSSTDQSGTNRWIMTHAQRPHTHDVKALVVCHVHDTSGAISRSMKPFLTLCSGGVDTKICTILVAKFDKGRPRVWFPWPTLSPISVAKSARLLLLQREGALELHQLGPQHTESLPVIVDEDKHFIGSLEIKGSHNLTCSDISHDGKFLIASTGASLLLFEISYIENDDGSTGFSPRQIILDNDVKSPCLAAKFISAYTIICVYHSGHIRLLKVSSSNRDDSGQRQARIRFASSLQSPVDSRTSSTKPFAIHSLVTSEDGRFFATVRSGVASGTVCVYAVKDDSIQHYWSVSSMEAPVSCVGFLLGIRPQLIIACCNYAMYVFDLKDRKFAKWSERNAFPVSSSLPEEFDRPFDFPKCVVTSSKSPDKFILGAVGSFCVVDLTMGMPKRCKSVPEARLRGHRKKVYVAETSDDPNYGNCTLCLRYNSIIHMGYLSEDEIVVVEQPWLNVVASFPAPLERKIYGT